MTRYKKRNLLLASLCLVVLVMAIGYAAFSSSLNISGTSNITSKWKIVITNITQKEIGGTAEEKVTPTFDSLNANFGVAFKKPGDYVTYTVTVENEGTLNATLDNIKINLDKTDIVSFKVDGLSSGDRLNAGNEKQFDVTFKYNENITTQPDKTDYSVSMNLNFLQEGNSTDFSGTDSPSVDTLAINSINLTPHETTIDVSVNASNATKYYYSLDNDKYFEALENSYIFSDLKILTEYTVWVKAEDNEGNVAVDSKKVTTVDTTKPSIKIEEKEIVEGNNGYKKGVTLTNTITDNGKVSGVMYCSSTNSTCTPSKETTLSNGKFDYIFEANKDAQTFCIKATDSANNSSTQCSSSYLVDNVNPTTDTITVTPDDDTMLVEVAGTDGASGLYKYYFSKDNGNTYVESNNPNYTFTELAEGDYLVMAYVEDKAGNVSTTKTATTTIKHADFCNHNGITDLGDCLIASEAKTTEIALAKQTIEAKGAPDFTKTSPAINYEDVHASSATTFSTTSSRVYIGTGYKFNSSEGTYTVTGGSNIDPSSIDYTKGDYYINPNITWNGTATTLYKVSSLTTSINPSTGQITYKFTKYNYTANISTYDTSEVGMYAGTDDDGTTYYFRGSTGGNYVKLDGKFYRVIRVNGDGSVRLVYDGTSAHANGEVSSDRQVGTSAFNSYISDNTYVGYMYGDVSKFAETDSGTKTFVYTGLSASTKYVYGTSYTLDKNTRTFKVAGDTHTGVFGTGEVGYYTCFSTDPNGSCQKIFYTTGYNSGSAAMVVKAKAYGTTSEANSKANVTNSDMKTYLENWYTNNLSSVDNKMNKDAVYCNDKTKSTHNGGTYTNEGYGINPTIYEYERFSSWNGAVKGPKLTCANNNDKYSITTTKGNGKLSKPIGLITADEVNMAGGKYSSQNSLYYLYTGKRWWTMSPSHFYNWFSAIELNVSPSGGLNASTVSGDYGIRPVINIDPSKITFTGSGTAQDPIVIN